MKDNTVNSLFVASIFGTYTGEKVRATFADGRTADYTKATLNLLISDPAVIEIYSLETGELFKYMDDNGEMVIC